MGETRWGTGWDAFRRALGEGFQRGTSYSRADGAAWRTPLSADGCARAAARRRLGCERSPATSSGCGERRKRQGDFAARAVEPPCVSGGGVEGGGACSGIESSAAAAQIDDNARGRLQAGMGVGSRRPQPTLYVCMCVWRGCALCYLRARGACAAGARSMVCARARVRVPQRLILVISISISMIHA